MVIGGENGICETNIAADCSRFRSLRTNVHEKGIDQPLLSKLWLKELKKIRLYSLGGQQVQNKDNSKPGGGESLAVRRSLQPCSTIYCDNTGAKLYRSLEEV